MSPAYEATTHTTLTTTTALSGEVEIESRARCVEHGTISWIGWWGEAGIGAEDATTELTRTMVPPR